MGVPDVGTSNTSPSADRCATTRCCAHTRRICPGYCPTTASAVTSVIPLQVACAIGRRSNGSRSIKPQRKPRGSTRKFARPSEFFMLIGKKLAALNNDSCCLTLLDFRTAAGSRRGCAAAGRTPASAAGAYIKCERSEPPNRPTAASIVRTRRAWRSATASRGDVRFRHIHANRG